MKRTIASAFVLTLTAAAPAMAQDLFAPPLQIPLDQQTIGVAVGDVNSDGLKDVVVSGCGCGLGASKLYVFLQTASGVLDSNPIVLFPPSGGGGVEIGDVTADGRNDIVLRAGTGFGVIAQSAAGGFDPLIVYPSTFTEGMRIGDLNGDGRLDAIGLEFSVNGEINTEEAAVLYQLPNGTFAPEVLVPLPHGYNDDVLVTDLNGDGRADVVIADPFHDPTIKILYQNADGTLSAPVALSVAPGVFASHVGVGDVNGDGRRDIVATYGTYDPVAHVAVLLQNSAGGFGAPTISDVASELTALEIADANGDGRQDVLLLHRQSLGILLQSPTGTLAAETLIVLPPAGGHFQQGFVAADINGDGAVDLAYSQVGSQGALTVLNGIPRPAPPVNRPPVAVADRVTIVCDDSITISVLANDSDPDGDALKVTKVSKPANGTSKITADGKRVKYEPKRRFRGTDRFTYTISDGRGGTATATVTVIVR